MSSRRKCDKRHISFLTSIYREGMTQKVCSFVPANFATRAPPLYSAKNSTCAAVVAMHSLLPRWVNRVGPSRQQLRPDVRFTSNSDQTAASQRSDAMCQPLHFALQEKQQPFSASDHTTADPESSNSANGDPAALRQITFARLKLLSVVHRISDHSAHPRR